MKKEQYGEALLGIAIPNGYRSGFNGQPHSDMDDHAMGDNLSIWTSWTTNINTAEHFAAGPDGKYNGVILTKRFKKSEVQFNISETAKLM